ncbi:ABC transporter permease, partial [Acidobacteria bacterium ACD]|nr:ABC transporter permease [Acidobacteria bacterium ACD]
MIGDLLRLAASAVAAHRLRTALTMLGIVVGIVSVQLLTSVGEGTRTAILSEFTQFGTHLLSIEPGKFRTTGLPGAAGGTVRKLTLDDADAVARVPGVTRVAPVLFGTARVATAERSRSVFVYGTTEAVPDVWRFRVGVGSFLPGGDPRRPRPRAVRGPTLVRGLFGTASPLGEKVRIGEHRFLVIGVMAPKGRLVGFDLDDA